MKIRIGTRQSLLALAQTDLVCQKIKKHFPQIEIEIAKKETKGDKNLSAALIEFGGKGAFVSEFEDALLENKIDIAIHSAKDLPTKIEKGLEIACVLPRENPYDVLIWKKDSFKKQNAIIGTSSPRRSLQIKELYDCQIKLLRGNVPTRLEKLKNGEYDAIILAVAGLKRLNLIEENQKEDENFIYEYFTEKEICPAGNQGIIAIECSSENKEVKEILKTINDEKTFLEFQIEKYILEKLECGCHEPTAVFSKIENDKIKINLVSEKNGKVFRIEKIGNLSNRFELAEKIIKIEKTSVVEPCVYLVGSGPGDEELLSVKAKNLISQADVIVYDNLANPMMLLECKKDCQKIFVGKVPNHHSKTQEEINAILIDLAKSGIEKIVRLKGGDPFVFGRGGEEVLALEKENINYQLVPGITSAISVLELAGIPVTHRQDARSFHVITGHTAQNDESDTKRFYEYAKLSGTLVFLMGIKNLPLIVAQLLEGGKDAKTPVSIVENGSTVLQRRIDGTLDTILEIAQKENAKNPAIIVVGKTASFEMQCKTLPLFDKRVCVTGTKAFIQKNSKKYKDDGAIVFSAPIIDTKIDEKAFEKIPDFSKIEWLIFTSSNGVRFFFDYLSKSKIDFRKLSSIKFATVGNGTADCLAEYGFNADFIPSKEFNVENLAKEFVEKISPSKKVVILRAEEGSKEINKIFTENKIDFVDIPIYSTLKNDFVLEVLENYVSSFDIITFSSSSGVKAFFEIPNVLSNLKKDVKFVCLGKKTQETLDLITQTSHLF